MVTSKEKELAIFYTMKSLPRPYNLATFEGKYNVRLWLKSGSKCEYKRVIIDNEQYKLGNIRITTEAGESILFVKSDIKRWEFDSKDCR